MTEPIPLPYSIFTENRPLRIAFLVNPDDQHAMHTVQAIIEYNQDKWGGRYNPIIFTNGKTIKEEWWQFLVNYDPDIIKSFVSISKPLLKKINNHLTPYLVEDFDLSRAGSPPSVHVDDEGLSVLPTKEAIAQVTGFSLNRTHLVLFEIDRYQENEINSFLKVNFGTYEPMLSTSSIIQQFPNRREFAVRSDAELVSALSSLNTFDTFVYPSLMCTIPSAALSHDQVHEEQLFTVVIGDSIEDLVYYWNRIFSVRFTRQTRLNAIWISRAMATNPDLLSALSIWIQRAVDPGGTGSHDVRFVSLSMTQAEVDPIATQILQGTFFRRVIDIKDSMPFADFKWDPNLQGIKERLHPIRVNGDEAHITVPPPSIQEGVMGGEHWMVDVYMEFHPERFTYIHGVNYWWQLPRHNDLAISLFHAQSRVCGNGIPAVLLKRDVPMISPYPNNKIKIKLLDDPSIFQILIVGDKTPAYTSDPRTSLAERPYGNSARSDKGRYLSGVLDLFSGLYPAHSFFESRYWRRMFDILSQQNPQKDEVRKQVIINKLKKQTRRDFTTDEGREWLAEYILQTSKDQSSSGKELPYQTFEKEAKKEVAEYNSINTQNPHRFEEEDLQDELKMLISAGILAMGVKPHCPSCGLGTWYHIDETKQLIFCKGCGYQHGLNPEQAWYYRLNSLVQEGVSRHYLIPVILSLGQLLGDARSSFIWTTSRDLYNKRSLGKSIGDLDIICIQDGNFIIGEVKNSCKLFKQEDFDKMGIIAKKIRPNKVVFAALEARPTPAVARMISDLASKLKKENIEVEWLSFSPWAFSPRPL